MQNDALIIEGDCLSVMEEIPSGSINLILTDLPYGTTQNRWDSVIPLELLWDQFKRILAPKGCVILTSQGPFTAKLILSNEEWFKYKITWVKSKATNFLNAKKQPLRKHEDVCVFYNTQPTYVPQMSEGESYDKGIRKNQLTGCYGDFAPTRVKSDGMRYPTDVVYFKTAESEGKVYHPTQKPLDLGRYLVRTYSKLGDVVLDCTCGSGSFPLAAALEGRKALGIELNQDQLVFKDNSIDILRVIEERFEVAQLRKPQILRDKNPDKLANTLTDYLSEQNIPEAGTKLSKRSAHLHLSPV